MMNNAWKINEGDRSYGKAWAQKDEGSPSKSAQGRGAPVGGAAG